MDAIERAITRIEAEFSHHPAIRLKLRIRKVWKLGLNHPRIVARYRGRAQVFRAECQTVDQAIRLVEHWYREEKRVVSRELAVKLGRIRSRLHFEIISEIRLLLRYLRRYDRDYYRHWIGVVLDLGYLEAAE